MLVQYSSAALSISGRVPRCSQFDRAHAVLQYPPLFRLSVYPSLILWPALSSFYSVDVLRVFFSILPCWFALFCSLSLNKIYKLEISAPHTRLKASSSR
jgi:hypothetical protein